MIEKLNLTNFRKHEDLVLDFIPGLNVVRGSNEAGKSTLQEAIGYALFGSKALRTNFADTVTWGRAESTLRVELSVNVGGRRLTFTRGKSGAEVIEGGHVIVTGQNEVSAFAASLLGCDGSAATNLIIASQNAMRGSLEQGPKATAALIEQLADFDLFDVLIEKIQTNLVVGAPAMFETRLREAGCRLAAFKPAPKPDEEAYRAWLTDQAGKVEALKEDVKTKYIPAIRELEIKAKAADEQARRHEAATTAVTKAEANLTGYREQRASFVKLAKELARSPVEIDQARKELAERERAAGAAGAYELFKALPCPPQEFEGTAEEFSAWLENQRNELNQIDYLRRENAAQLQILSARIVQSNTCTICGQDVSQFPAVAEANAKAEAEMAKLREDAEELTKKRQEVAGNVDAGKEIDAINRAYQKTLARIGQYVEIDNMVTPPKVTWDGPAPAAVDVESARKHLATLESNAAQAQQYEAKADTLISVIEEASERLQQAKQMLESTPQPADSQQLLLELAEWKAEASNIEARIEEMKEDTEKAKALFRQQQAEYELKQGEHDRLQADVDQRKKDLDDLAFNNALLKKVRAARPIIADKLWNTVLAAVSTMFSQMRGEPSVVSKDNGGFKVNGQPIEALSGSTLDILGLAIRTALVKTFIPHAAFMLLDEAAAACDEDRTGSLLGFVAGSGFEQVVLVTHESASEAVADKVIQL